MDSTHVRWGGGKSFRWNPLYPLDSNRFQCLKRYISIRNGRSKIVFMLNEVEKMQVQASSTTRVSKGFILIFWMRLFFSALVSFKNVLGQQRIDLLNWSVAGAFLWDDPDRNQWSKSTRIIVHLSLVSIWSLRKKSSAITAIMKMKMIFHTIAELFFSQRS